MGQIEVYEFLKTQRLTKNNAYFSVAEVEKGLQERGFSNGVIHNVRGCLLRLESFGYVEAKMNGKVRDWKRLFRLKAKYVQEAKE